MRGTVIHTILSLALLGLFCVPTFVPTIHSLADSHEHNTCDAENSIHLHDHEPCKLCDYLISIKNFHVDEPIEWCAPTRIAEEGDHPGIRLYVTSMPTTDVRGPPLLA